jgi:NADH-quinone oxidoreductase subunit A
VEGSIERRLSHLGPRFCGKIVEPVNPYLPIVVMIALASVICIAMVCLSWLLGPKKSTAYKESPFECGVAPTGSAHERFPIKFYLTAMLFILFDIEVVFLWSWMTVFRGWVEKGSPSAMYSFWAVMVYMVLWFLGDFYVLRSGALEWEESKTLHPEKFGKAVDEEAPYLHPVSEDAA